MELRDGQPSQEEVIDFVHKDNIIILDFCCLMIDLYGKDLLLNCSSFFKDSAA